MFAKMLSVLANDGRHLPMNSWTMNRETRVPASIVVNMNSASERYKALLEQVDAYGQSFKSAEILFQQGVGTSIDYLIAKNNLDRANISLIIARYDLVLRSRRVVAAKERISGTALSSARLSHGSKPAESRW